MNLRIDQQEIRASRIAIGFLLVTSIALIALSLALLAKDPASNYFGPSAVFVGGGYLSLVAWNLSALRISSSQLVYRRRARERLMRWAEVSRVEIQPWRLVVHTQSERIFVPYGAFADGAKMRKAVLDAVAAHRPTG